MKIFALQNYNYNNQLYINNTKNNNYEKTLKPLMCDEVSFSANSNQNELKENSQKIWDKIENLEYEEACEYIDSIGNKKWNPNYIQGKGKEKISIVGLIFSNLAFLDINKKDKEKSLELYTKVISHPKFKIFNKQSLEDAFVYALTCNIPDIYCTMLTKTNDFQKMSANDRMTYYEMAIGNEKNKVANSILNAHQNLETDKPKAANELNLEEMQIEELKDSVSEFKVDTSSLPNGFADVGGMYTVKKQLTESIINPWNEKYRKAIELNKLDRPSGVIISGPPGCGKTYIIQALSKETGYDMYTLNLGNAGSPYIHETGAQTSALFNNLETLYKKTGKPSILFLDELDAMGRSRQASDQDYKKDEINTLLIEMNNSAQRGIILVGATNLLEDIDEAVMRPGRLDTKIVMDYPQTREEMKPIVMRYLADKPLAKDLLPYVDIISDKLIGTSPAFVRNVINKTLYDALYNDKQSADLETFKRVLDAENKAQKEVVSKNKPIQIGFKIKNKQQ